MTGREGMVGMGPAVRGRESDGRLRVGRDDGG